MKSLIRITKPTKHDFCIVCTQHATQYVILGKVWEHSLNANQFCICDDCAANLVRKITSVLCGEGFEDERDTDA